MDIQSSMYAAALQQPSYSFTDTSVSTQQVETGSVSARPVERVTPPAEGNEAPVLGGQLDVYA